MNQRYLHVFIVLLLTAGYIYTVAPMIFSDGVLERDIFELPFIVDGYTGDYIHELGEMYEFIGVGFWFAFSWLVQVFTLLGVVLVLPLLFVVLTYFVSYRYLLLYFSRKISILLGGFFGVFSLMFNVYQGSHMRMIGFLLCFIFLYLYKKKGNSLLTLSYVFLTLFLYPPLTAIFLGVSLFGYIYELYKNVQDKGIKEGWRAFLKLVPMREWIGFVFVAVGSFCILFYKIIESKNAFYSFGEMADASIFYNIESIQFFVSGDFNFWSYLELYSSFVMLDTFASKIMFLVFFGIMLASIWKIKSIPRELNLLLLSSVFLFLVVLAVIPVFGLVTWPLNFTKFTLPVFVFFAANYFLIRLNCLRRWKSLFGVLLIVASALLVFGFDYDNYIDCEVFDRESHELDKFLGSLEKGAVLASQDTFGECAYVYNDVKSFGSNIVEVPKKDLMIMLQLRQEYVQSVCNGNLSASLGFSYSGKIKYPDYFALNRNCSAEKLECFNSDGNGCVLEGLSWSIVDGTGLDYLVLKRVEK